MSGREAHCNFCTHYFEVPAHYASNLDYSGLRKDKSTRAELNLGSVDYLAPKDYYKDRATQPQPPAYLFLIEITRSAVSNGIVHQLCATIRSLLKHLPGKSTQMGIVLFDSVVHLVTYGGASGEPRLVVMGDVDEPFCGCSPDEVFLDPRKFGNQVEQALDMIPNWCAETEDAESCGAAALKTAVELISARGGTGQVFSFVRTLPGIGRGAMADRDDPRLYADHENLLRGSGQSLGLGPGERRGAVVSGEGTGSSDLAGKKFGSLFVPQDQDFQKGMLDLCIRRDVVVDVFLMPKPGAYIDVTTHGYVLFDYLWSFQWKRSKYPLNK